MNRYFVIRGAIIVLLAATSTIVLAQEREFDGVIDKPIDAILELFDTYPIVALGEGNHGNIQGHEFRLSLFRDPRFAKTVQDIVVEFGNGLYQPMIDDYINGADIPIEELRQVWEDTSQAHQAWDKPIYEEFYRTIRKINQSLPKNEKIRVLLGDSPQDWEKALKGEEGLAMNDRTSYLKRLVRDEVIAKGRHAIMIYGGEHLVKKNKYARARKELGLEQKTGPSTIVRIENENDIQVFTIVTNVLENLTPLIQESTQWQLPALIMLNESPLGLVPIRKYGRHQRMLLLKDGVPHRVEVDPTLRLVDVYDAMLYFGDPSKVTYSPLMAERCADEAYIAKRVERIEFLEKAKERKNIGLSGADRFKLTCNKAIEAAGLK